MQVSKKLVKDTIGLLKRVQWSGIREGMGCGPQGSGPGPKYSCCPICRGFRSENRDFDDGGDPGHKKNCDLDAVMHDLAAIKFGG